MASTATRPNHYELLGLTPAASEREIADAFARAMSMFRPHAVEDVAQLSVAYATLRNPARRRAYDDSLGLNPRPEPRHPTMPAIRFSGSARWDPMVRPAADPVPAPAPPPEPEAPVAEEPASFAAEPEHEPPKPDAPNLPEFLAVRRAAEDIEPDARNRAIDWKLPALATGGLLVAAALAGAWAGLDAGNGGAQQQAKRAASIALPPLKPLPGGLDTPPAATPDRVEERPRQAAPASIAVRRVERPSSVAPTAGSEERLAEISQSLESSYDGTASADSPSGQGAAEAPPAQASAASLPISNRTAARTIERIGYACGRIAATTPVEGEATGVYKVTCTSGQSYRAAPVNGRYRFKRWTRR
jgi:curved DNA-binding protein CbpA